MSKRYLRYFFDALDGQQKWLNQMAKKGYRLVKTTNLTYQFVECQPMEYQYRVEFVADKYHRELKDYEEFLANMGYITMEKNMNLHYGIGKVKWRPWLRKGTMVATSPGNYNKELLIIEKKNDGTPFAMHTDHADIVSYLSKIRNTYLWSFLLLILLTILAVKEYEASDLLRNAILGCVAVLSAFYLYITIRYSLAIHKYKQTKKIYE